MYYQQGDEITNNTIRTIESICSRSYTNYLYKYPNVIGMGRGIKLVNGEFTGIPSITFFVSKKVPIDQIPQDKRVPTVIQNIKTDVIEVGEVKAQSLDYFNHNPINYNKYDVKYSNIQNSLGYSSYNNSSFFDNNTVYNRFNNTQNSFNNNYKTFANQAIGGIGIGAVGANNTGTLACAVSDKNNIYLLSTNHVLAGNNKLPIATPVYRSTSNNAPADKSNYLAHLSKFVSIIFRSPNTSAENRVDAAIAMIGNKNSENEIFSQIIQKGVQGIGKIAGTSTVSIEQDIVKSGAASALTNGTVWAVSSTILVNYDGKGTALFTNQILTSSMSKPGDSGSLGLDSNGNIFGLLFAGSDSATVYNPIQDVLSTLQVQVVM